MVTNRVVPNARQRVRAAVSADIVAEARRQLGEVGASALSLRSVARELGMASSAVYRYFPSRDDLLTELIVDAYDSIGAAAEEAAATSEKPFVQLQRVCRAVRGWSLEHPQEYMLIYGSPVPGYVAPDVTVAPASRVILVLAALLNSAQRSGRLAPVTSPALPRAVASEIRTLAQTVLPDVPLANVTQGLLAWIQLFGFVSFEVFGRLEGLLERPDVFFDHSIVIMASSLGISPS